MLTIPSLIVVSVTPRNDAVSAGCVLELVAWAAAVTDVDGAAAFLALLEQAASNDPTRTATTINGVTRRRVIGPPSNAGPSPSSASTTVAAPLRGRVSVGDSGSHAHSQIRAATSVRRGARSVAESRVNVLGTPARRVAGVLRSRH